MTTTYRVAQRTGFCSTSPSKYDSLSSIQVGIFVRRKLDYQLSNVGVVERVAADFGRSLDCTWHMAALRDYAGNTMIPSVCESIIMNQNEILTLLQQFSTVQCQDASSNEALFSSNTGEVGCASCTLVRELQFRRPIQRNSILNKRVDMIISAYEPPVDLTPALVQGNTSFEVQQTVSGEVELASCFLSLLKTANSFDITSYFRIRNLRRTRRSSPQASSFPQILRRHKDNLFHTRLLNSVLLQQVRSSNSKTLTELLHDQKFYLLKMVDKVECSVGTRPFELPGALVTGGTGAIGLLTTTWLTNFIGYVLSVSKTGRIVNSMDLNTNGIVAFSKADAGFTPDMEILPDRPTNQPSHQTPLVLFHCAGVLKDQCLCNINMKSFRIVMAPKSSGLLALVKQHCPSAIIAFGSLSAIVGNEGQHSYMVANLAMDSIAMFYREQGIYSSTIHWGPWKTHGMATNRIQQAMESKGIGLIPPESGLQTLEMLLSKAEFMRHALCATAQGSGDANQHEHGLPDPADNADAQNTMYGSGVIVDSIAETILKIASSFTVENLSESSILLENGLDSMTAVDLAAALTRALGVPLPTTLVFDYPTPAEIFHFVHSKRPLVQDLQKRHAEMPSVGAQRADPVIHIVDFAQRSPKEAEQNIYHSWKQGMESQSITPFSRWDVDAHYAPELLPSKSYVRFASWIQGIYWFDRQAFNLLPNDCITMDPQLRILLELVLQIRYMNSVSQQMGCFVGIMYNEYLDGVLKPAGMADTVASSITGTGMAFVVGHMSYHHSFGGPSIAIDTACSSSLVSVHLARQALVEHSCSQSLSNGINLMLLPQTTSRICLLKALSPEGRCLTADVAASGYGRGESGWSILLQPQSTEKDLDSIAVIMGSRVAHNGSSAGLTAPNGSSQTALIRGLWKFCGNVQPQTASLHGTGTVLGDPIEIGALIKLTSLDETPIILQATKVWDCCV